MILCPVSSRRASRGAAALLALLGALSMTSTALAQLVPSRGWEDSYSANGRCYCASSFDHGAGNLTIDTPAGPRSARQVCAAIGPGPGVGSNPIYNDLQCGNGPPNDSEMRDEQICPGRVDLGVAGCQVKGPRWNLARAFGAAPAAPVASSPPPISYEAIVAGDTTIADLQAAAQQGLYPDDPDDPRGDQSCLTFPQRAKSGVQRVDLERAIPDGAHFGWWNADGASSITDQGALRLTLQPRSGGSNHFTSGITLDDPVERITVTQILDFDENFSWGSSAKAGKIGFGVGGGSTPTGGRGETDGWTARLMWREARDRSRMQLAFYLYHAGRPGKWGEDEPFNFELVAGQPIVVTYTVQVNSGPGRSDGWIKGWINGELVAERDGIMWTRTGSVADTRVSKIIGSTFHGGNTSAWSPRRASSVEISGVCWAEGDAGARLVDIEKPYVPLPGTASLPDDVRDLPGVQAALQDLADSPDAAQADASLAIPDDDDAGTDSPATGPDDDPVTSAGFGTGTCAVDAPARSLLEAFAAFASACPMHPRTDCDPIPGGGYTCSSHQIGSAAPAVSAPPADPLAASSWIDAGRPRNADANAALLTEVRASLATLFESPDRPSPAASPSSAAGPSPVRPDSSAPVPPFSGGLVFDDVEPPLPGSCLVDSIASLDACLGERRAVVRLTSDLSCSGAECCPAGRPLLDLQGQSGTILDGGGHRVSRLGGQRSCSVLDVANASDVTIRDLALDDDADTPPCAADDECPRMVHVRASTGVSLERVDVSHSKGYAIYVQDTRGFELTDSRVAHSGVLGLYVGHGDRPSTDVRITGSTFEANATNALALLGVAGDSARSNLVENNRFENNHRLGRWAVAPRYGSGFTGGGQLYIARAEGITVRGNTIVDGECVNCLRSSGGSSGVHGIELGEPGRGGVDAVVITGNTIRNNDGAAVYTNLGVTLGAGVSIAGNRLSGNGSGVRAPGASVDPVRLRSSP